MMRSLRIAVLAVAMVGFVASMAVASGFVIEFSPGAAGTFDISAHFNNFDTYNISSLGLDFVNTSSTGDSTPLIYDQTPSNYGIFGIVTGGIGTTPTVDSIVSYDEHLTYLNTSDFGYGDWLSYSIDPDIESNPGYGATLSELAGTVVFVTFEGVSNPALDYPGYPSLYGYWAQVSAIYDTSGAFSGWQAIIPSPGVAVPEPSTMILLGSGLLGIACFRRRRNDR